jgi:hypothetical protein
LVGIGDIMKKRKRIKILDLRIATWNGVINWQSYQTQELIDKINEIIERLNEKETI